MIPAQTLYTRASDAGHALELLAEPDAKVIAGGQSLIPVMKLRIARPSLVIDISRIELRGAGERDGALHIGPLTTWSELIDAEPITRAGLEAIAECARGIGDLQVRNLGTIGGSVAHADPASDMPAVLLALAAMVVIRSREDERTIPLDDLMVGPFTTTLRQQDLITEIIVPLPEPGTGSAYVSVEHPASGFALAGAAASVGPNGERVAVTGIAARPFLVSDPDDPVGGTEVFGDRFAPAEYRRHLAIVLVDRALERASERAKEER